MVLRKYYIVFGNIGMIDNMLWLSYVIFCDINVVYKKYICMVLINYEMCLCFDDFVILIIKIGGVLDF